MRPDAVGLEESRVGSIGHLDEYGAVHERHRVFPAVFRDHPHERVIDISAGVGVVAKRIKDHYPCTLVCNDMSPSCVKLLRDNGIDTCSFDLDTPDGSFPFPDGHFDAIVCLATIEHIIHLDHFVAELRRILADDGRLYLSAPNYAGLGYLLRFLASGRAFHDPLVESEKYEFYAHVRYFTYRTLVEFVGSRGFTAETAFLPLPEGSTRFRALRERSKVKAGLARLLMRIVYSLGSPRWCSEPVLCFAKAAPSLAMPNKVVL